MLIHRPFNPTGAPGCAVALTAVLLALMTCSKRALAQPTQFTYQGQLKDAGVAVNGPYDFTFRIFDTDVAGTQIGADLAVPGLPVTNGLFTVPLDFGAGVFDGTPRWLEIEVSAVVLAPRQPLTSAPYAQTSIRSQSCGISDYSNGPWTPSGLDLFYLAGNVGIGTDLPTAKLEIGGTPGVDGIKFPDGSIQTSAAGVGGGGYWTPDGANIFNNNGGNVGIGLTTPMAKLHIGGTPGADGIMFPDGSLQTTAATGGGGSSIWSLNGIDAYYTAGKVGIGTSAPASTLDIAAIGNGAEVLRLSTERPWVFSQQGTGSTTRLRLAPSTGLKNFEITAPAGGPVATFFADETHPAVGIGTATPVGTLSISAPTFGSLNIFNSGVGDFTFDGGSDGIFGFNNVGGASGSIDFASNHGMYVRFANTGNVGIGTSAPASKLDIAATGNGAQLLRLSTERPWVFRQTLTGPSTGLELYSTSGQKQFRFTAMNGTPVATFVADDAAPQLIVNGTTVTKVLQITGADLAEKFPTSDKVEPGMVVAIDAENPGQLCLARGAYNHRVAGIVSGAGDIPVGAILGNLPGKENAPPIALSGRVWVRCDASSGAIRPGDLLTTSDTPGHAMKSIDRERAYGSVIGKAMTGLKEGKGLVLVLVNLQ